jgi:hypothetical protein
MLNTSKAVGVEENTEKTRYTFKPHQQNAKQNLNIKIQNKSLKNVAEFKYFITKATN